MRRAAIGGLLALAAMSRTVAAEPVEGTPVTKTTYTYAERGSVALKADVYDPQASPFGARRPVLVFVHGGGWTCGNRDAFVDLPQRVARIYGVVAVSASYRLAPVTDAVVVDGRIVSPGVQDGCGIDTRPTDALGLPQNRLPFAAQLDDLRLLMQQLRRYAADLRIDPQRIAVLGASAGGHLAGMLGAGNAVPNPFPAGDAIRVPVEAEIDSRPNAIISVSGPWDLAARGLTNPSIPGILRNLFNGAPTAQQLDAGSPISYVALPPPAAPFPPTLFLHGEDDTLVPKEQSISACARMPACAGAAPLIVKTPEGVDPHDSLYLLQARWPEVVAFLGALYAPASAVPRNH